MPMTQARRSSRRINSPRKKPIKHRLREIVLIFFCFVGLYLFVSLLTYYGSDPGWLHSFGYFAYLFPIMVGYMGWLIYQGRHHDILAEPRTLIVPGIGFVLTLTAGCGLAIVHFMAESALLPTHAGGILGLWVGNGLVSIVDRLGATLSWLKLMDTLGYHTLQRWPAVKKYLSSQFWPWFLEQARHGLHHVKKFLIILFKKLQQGIKAAYTRWQARHANWREERKQFDMDSTFDEDDDDYFIKDESPVDETASSKTQSTSEQTSQHNLASPEPPLLPSLNLLESVPEQLSSPDVKILSQRIIDTFAAWQLKATINATQPGPVLTRFELKIIPSIEAKYFEELGEALAKALKLEHVQITETQPGMVDILTPNFKRQTIYLKHLLQTPEFQCNSSPLAVALGTDISGHPIIIDLSKIPHILMAGREVAEKRIAINTLIMSLLFKSEPTVVRFLLIDNNTQTLSIYADLPHLLMPVLTDMALCAPALGEDYNQAILLQEDAESNTALFYVVIIINELAELMTTRIEKQTEPFLIALIQKARAAGIHIILATQNPTVNVITGLIKANIPTRMAFKTTHQTESRTILGQTGEETLLGDGDMLYMTAGTRMPVRVHGGFVSDFDVQNVISDLKARATPDYINLDEKFV